MWKHVSISIYILTESTMCGMLMILALSQNKWKENIFLSVDAILQSSGICNDI